MYREPRFFSDCYINKNMVVDQHLKAIEKGQLKAKTRFALQTSLSSIQRHTGMIKTIIILTLTLLHSVYARYRSSISHQHIKRVKACIFTQLYIYIYVLNSLFTYFLQYGQ